MLYLSYGRIAKVFIFCKHVVLSYATVERRMKEIEILKQGGIGVIATDTLYGVVARALNQVAVERVYALKGRTTSKPCIILISSFEELALFGVAISAKQRETLSRYVPGPVSFILSCDATAPEYLHRGTHTLAFRIPRDARIQEFLRDTGPLIAPSTNPEGFQPATTTEEARKYFGDQVDFYKDEGVRKGIASTLVAFDENNKLVTLRQGIQKI
jgi:L-threonylcarbamoyladenylate synthase